MWRGAYGVGPATRRSATPTRRSCPRSSPVRARPLPGSGCGRPDADRLDPWRARLAIHSVEVRVLPVASPEASQASLLAHLINSEQKRATAALEEIASGYGPESSYVVGIGPPADAILDAAAQHSAELIVVGTHGRSGFRRLTLGSVAESVVRRASCSVLVVRLAT